jgi:hypothetical protein
METFYQLLGLISAGLIIWLLYRSIKARPDVFSRDNMNKSLSSMGVLALALIIFIGLLVMMLNYA